MPDVVGLDEAAYQEEVSSKQAAEMALEDRIRPIERSLVEVLDDFQGYGDPRKCSLLASVLHDYADALLGAVEEFLAEGQEEVYEA